MRSWGMVEEYGITFPEWKEVDECQEIVDITSLPTKCFAVLPEVESLLNRHVESTVILNEIT